MPVDYPYTYNTAITSEQTKSEQTDLARNMFIYDDCSNIFGAFYDSHKVIKSTKSYSDLECDSNSSLIELNEFFYISSFYEVKRNDSNITEINSFIDNLKKYFLTNSDDGLIFIFQVLDKWNPNSDIEKYNKLFSNLIDVEFNEDIYVSILSATLKYKKEQKRIEYFNFIKTQLNKKYSEDETLRILKGL